MASDENRLSQYKTLKRIGAGRFGEVFKVQHKITGELFCHKVVAYKGLNEKEKEQLVMEVNVMRDLKHPNIVRYVDRVVDRNKHLLYIIMEYCDSGDLAENMRQFHKHYERVNEQVIFDIALQLLFALAYCHNSSIGPKRGRILHRDIKPQNIFLHSNNRSSNQKGYICKIGDFGLCRSIGMESFAHSCVGTPYYWCPELLLSHNKKYDDKMDMWALGCVLYELSCGKTPFHKATTLAELAQQMKKGVPLPLPGRSRELNSLLFALLQPDSRRRASAIQCLGLSIWEGPVNAWFWETVTPRDRENIYNNINRRDSVKEKPWGVVVRAADNAEGLQLRTPTTPTTQRANITFRTSTNFEDSDDDQSTDDVALKKTPSVGTTATPDSQDTPLSCSNRDVIAYNRRQSSRNRNAYRVDGVSCGMYSTPVGLQKNGSMGSLVGSSTDSQESTSQGIQAENYMEDALRTNSTLEHTPTHFFRTPTQVRHEETQTSVDRIETAYSPREECDDQVETRTVTSLRATRRYLPIFRNDTPVAKRPLTRVPHSLTVEAVSPIGSGPASSRMKYIKEKQISK